MSGRWALVRHEDLRPGLTYASLTRWTARRRSRSARGSARPTRYRCTSGRVGDPPHHVPSHRQERAPRPRTSRSARGCWLRSTCHYLHRRRRGPCAEAARHKPTGLESDGKHMKASNTHASINLQDGFPTQRGKEASPPETDMTCTCACTCAYVHVHAHVHVPHYQRPRRARLRHSKFQVQLPCLH